MPVYGGGEDWVRLGWLDNFEERQGWWGATSGTGGDYYITISDTTTNGWITTASNWGSRTWNAATTSSNTLYTYYGEPFRMYRDEVLPVEQAVDEVRRAAWEAQVQQERMQRSQDRVVANGRALQLLSELLDEAQQASYRLDGFFEIIGSHGTLYRLHRGTSGNVEWIKPDGTSGGRLCAHPSMRESWLPTEDVLLAQLLALTHDERAWLAVANLHAGERPPVMRYDSQVVAA